MTTQKIVINLKKMGFTDEQLAVKFHVTSRTIIRWRLGENKPSKMALRYIRQIYNGYLLQKS